MTQGREPQMTRSYGMLTRLTTWLSLLLLLPFMLLAVVPLLVMLVPVAVVGVPIIAPVMLSGLLAARCERQRLGSRSRAATGLERTAVGGAA